MPNAFVIGAGMTNFGKFPDRDLRSLAEEATASALASSGVTSKDINAVFAGNAVAGLITGQENIRGQVLLRNTGIVGVPIFNVENACATSSSAFHLAWMSVVSGQYDVVLVLGAEKLTHIDKSKSLAAFDSSLDLGELPAIEKRIGFDTAQRGKRSIFMDLYAAGVVEGDSQGSESSTPLQQALVSVKNHRNGSLNPNAQYRNEVTADEVLASRKITANLTIMMCAPVGDGAAAIVVANEEWAKRNKSRSIRVRGTAFVSGRADDVGMESGLKRAAALCYERAGLGPSDIGVAEVHDAIASAELSIYEGLGFCPKGEGGALVESGHTQLGGRLPVNPSGGLLSRGHPIGATGAAQIAEIYWQLTGQADRRQVAGARIGMTQNGGGFLGTDAAAMSVNVFESLSRH